MYTKINKLLIISVICFYLLFNIYISKYYNIFIFILLYSILNLFVKDKMNILIMIYIFIIVLSIITHFHLLENFTVNNNYKNTPNQSIKDNTNLDHDTSDTESQISPDESHQIINNIKNIVINDLSERLIKKYVEKVKRETPLNVFTRKVKIMDIVPIKSEISLSKLKSMKKNDKILQKPLIITNDNFIIDGHHRWYNARSKIKENNLDSNNDYDFITCIIIKDNIQNFIRKISEFKNEYNDKEMNGFKIDHNKLKKSTNSINVIKKHIKVLEDYNNQLYKLNIV